MWLLCDKGREQAAGGSAEAFRKKRGKAWSDGGSAKRFLPGTAAGMLLALAEKLEEEETSAL